MKRRRSDCVWTSDSLYGLPLLFGPEISFDNEWHGRCIKLSIAEDGVKYYVIFCAHCFWRASNTKDRICVVLSDYFVLVELYDVECTIVPSCVSVGFFGISLPIKLRQPGNSAQ